MSKGFAAGGNEPWSSTRVADYRAMRAAGATRIRTDLSWVTVQPEPGAFDFSSIDPVLVDAGNAGLSLLAILHTVPVWANSGRGDYAPADDPGLFSEYCYHTAVRCIQHGMTEFELGNEVNLEHPGWTTTGGYYVGNLLRPGHEGVVQASQELGVPVMILMGALAPGPVDPPAFLADVYDAGGADLFDALSYHPYTNSPRTEMQIIPDELDAITVSKTGDSLNIWATEYGAPTGGEWSVSEARQTELVTEAHQEWYSYPYAGPMFWYSHRDRVGEDRENHFGLLRADGTRKPAYNSYRRV